MVSYKSDRLAGSGDVVRQCLKADSLGARCACAHAGDLSWRDGRFYVHGISWPVYRRPDFVHRLQAV